MKRQIFYIIIVFFVSCNSLCKVPKCNPSVVFKITTSQKNVLDTLLLKVEVRNNSDKDIWILQNYKSYVGSNLFWDIDVLFQDSIELYSPILINYTSPSKKDYVCIKAQESYFSEDAVSLEDWQSSYLLFGKNNKNYGKYRIRLTYYDAFHSKSHSLKGKYKSNEIYIIFDQDNNAR